MDTNMKNDTRDVFSGIIRSLKQNFSSRLKQKDREGKIPRSNKFHNLVNLTINENQKNGRS